MDTKIFTKKNKYLMLALDHRGSFKRLLNPEDPEATPTQKIIETKFKIIKTAYDQFSGILIDPTFGLPAFEKIAQQNEKKKPFLLCTEKSGYEAEKNGRFTSIQYPAAELKDMGAAGIKLLLYFNPYNKAAEHQITIGRKALEDAHGNNLPIFIEFVSYQETKEQRPLDKIVLDSIEMALSKNVKPDVWKLEYPGSLAACQKISALVKDTPWILLTRGSKYEIFKKQLKDAITAGAAGFLAGRALWQEGMALDDEQQNIFLETTFCQRFQEITDICLK